MVDLQKHELENIYGDRIEEIYTMLEELIAADIIEETYYSYDTTESSYDIITNLINTKGTDFIKIAADGRAKDKFELIAYRNEFGNKSELESLTKIVNSYKISRKDMISIKEINDCKIHDLSFDFEVIFYHHHFITKGNFIEGLLISDLLQKQECFEHYINAFSKHLIFIKAKERLTEIEAKETTIKPIAEIENIDVIEINGYKNKVAILDKLGVLKSIYDNLEIKNDSRLFAVLSSLGIFNNKTTILPYLKDIEEGNFYNDKLIERVNKECHILQLNPLCKK